MLAEALSAEALRLAGRALVPGAQAGAWQAVELVRVAVLGFAKETGTRDAIVQMRARLLPSALRRGRAAHRLMAKSS